MYPKIMSGLCCVTSKMHERDWKLFHFWSLIHENSALNLNNTVWSFVFQYHSFVF